MVAPNYESVIGRQQKRIAELEHDIRHYSAQIRHLKSRGRQHAAASFAQLHFAATPNALPQSLLTPPNTPEMFAARAAAAAAAAAAATTTAARSGRTGNEEDDRAGKTRYWTEMEHNQFLYAGRLFGPKNYVAISQYVGTRTPKQVRTHAQKYQMKLDREARKRRAQAAAVAAAGAPGAAAAAAAVAAAAAACEEQRVNALANATTVFGSQSAAEAAIEAAAASAVMAGMAFTNQQMMGMQFANYRPMDGAMPTEMNAVQRPAEKESLNSSVLTEEATSAASGERNEDVENTVARLKEEPMTESLVSDDAENNSPPFPQFECDDGAGLQYLRDSACSPVSNDSGVESDVLVMVDEKGGVVHDEALIQTTMPNPASLCPGMKKNSSLGNLADYDDFMRKVTNFSGGYRSSNMNMFDQDGEIELEMLGSAKTEPFEDAMLEDL